MANKSALYMPIRNTILYGVTALLLILSFVKDRGKTKNALKKAWKAFENILPQFLVVIVLVSLLLSLLDHHMILKLIGSESGWFGVLLAAIVGSVTMIPGFVAFPTAALLVEMQYFGKKLAIYRNALAFVFSFLVAFVIGQVMEVLVCNRS